MAEAPLLVIGELAVRDTAAVASLQQQVMPHPWSERQFADSIVAGHCCLLARTPAGEPVAVAVASRVQGEAELLTLATAQQHQRSGVGRALLVALLQRMAREGAEVCFLEVMEGNAPALALYQQLGFVLVGRRPGYYVLTDGVVDALLMRAELKYKYSTIKGNQIVKLLETQWWAMPIGQEWQVEVDEETVIVSDEDGVGSLEISVLEWDDGEVVAEDLQVLSQQLIPEGVVGQAAVCGQWHGRHYSYVDHEDACRDWLLIGGQKVMLVSYTCDPENQGMDDAAVDEMLAGLELRTG